MFRRELSELYLSIALRGLALSMVGIFIPLYLYYELAFPLKEVFLFYIIYSVAFGIFTPIVAKLSTKIGFKYCILISSFFHISFFAFLYYLDLFSLSLIFLAIIFGIAQAFFWFSFHADFAKYSDHAHKGGEVSLWYAISSISSIIGPFIGGLILSIPELGFNWLFIIVSMILIGSAIPVFFLKQEKPKPFSFKNILSKIKFREAVAFAGNGMEFISSGVLWPLFVFIILKKYFLMGSLASFISIFMVIFTIGVGKLSDGIKKKKIMYFGGLILAASWFIRGFVRTIFQVFTVAFIGASASTLTNVPFSALTYDRIKRNNLMQYLVLREVFLNFGRVLLLVVMLLLVNFTRKWFVGFSMAGIGGLLQLLF